MAKQEAETKAKKETQEKAKQEAETKAKKETDMKTKQDAEAEAKSKTDAEQKANMEGEAKSKKDSEGKAGEDAEPKKVEAKEAETKEAVAEMTQEDGPGTYTIVHAGTWVTLNESKTSRVSIALKQGTQVNVLEVKMMSKDHRLRARIADPPGWISLKNLDDGYRWAVKVTANVEKRTASATSGYPDDSQAGTEYGTLQTGICRGLRKASGYSDAGWADEFRGWYDVQGCGQCLDYCRWVGDSGSGGDPALHTEHNESFWSCNLAGSDDMHTVKGRFGPTFVSKKCAGVRATARQGGAQTYCCARPASGPKRFG